MPEMLGYLLLFTGIGAGFVLVNLMAGKFIRPAKMNAEKGTIYECGEPTVGSAWVQFDLRFYVVALLFVIFDVEMAFFFPWAVVFGKYVALSDPGLPTERRVEINSEFGPTLPPAERIRRADMYLNAESPDEIQKQKDKWERDVKELRDRLPALDARIANAQNDQARQSAQAEKQVNQGRLNQADRSRAGTDGRKPGDQRRPANCRLAQMVGILRHPVFFRRAAGWLCLPVEARRPRLGAQHGGGESDGPGHARSWFC